MLSAASDFLALAAAELAARKRLNLPPGRCPRCQDWPEMACYEDDERSPARTCGCGFAPVVVHIVNEEMPIGYLAES